MRNVITLVLGGGRGTRLYPLTKFRSKPAVPLAGKYRLIDIPLSNCINSDLRRIYVLTQFMSVSLHRHIRQTYRFDSFSAGFVEILAAQQTMDGTDWYEGTADAVRKNVRYLEQSDIDYVVILSGDQLYRMDYREMIKTHIESEADATIAAIPVDRKDAAALGIMRLGEDGSVHGFVEKPSTEEQLSPVLMDPAWIEARGIESRGRECLASMGIYVFNRDLLVDVLKNTSYQDFGKEIFPTLIKPKNVQVHLFDGYWEDIGTIRSFYESNLNLTTEDPEFELMKPGSPIYTRARFLPPTRMSGATVSDSLIANGCKIGTGAIIENSVIGLRTVIGPNVTIRNSIVMGNDFYDSKERADERQSPLLEIGEGTVIEGAIIDKNVCIGKNAKIINQSQRDQTDLKHDTCVIRDGIPILIKKAVIPDNWNLEENLS